MTFDFKKEYKEYYLPTTEPSVVDVPAANFVAVRGKGDPNDESGEYKASIEILYGVAYAIKMSKMGDRRIEGYFDFVVPPLEGLWWTGGKDVYGPRKEDYQFISMIRLPDFVTKEDFDWAVEEAARKQKADFSRAEFLRYEEGRCIQCLHVGSYDMEPVTIGAMRVKAKENGYEFASEGTLLHHEIYLSDPRKTDADKLRTVIRYPIRPIAL